MGWITVEREVKKESPEHDPVLINGLVESYHKKAAPSFEVHQDGVQAGIRYALIALGIKIEGINK